METSDKVLRRIERKLDMLLARRQPHRSSYAKYTTPNSQPEMIAKLLAKYPDGLRVDAIVKLLKKRKFKTEAKDIAACVTTMLYRHQGGKFRQVKTGIWTVNE